MKVIITGGSGYLGSRLIQELSDQNYDAQIKVISRFSTVSKKEFVKRFPHCEILKKDISKISKSDLEGFDVVVHLAAIASVSGCDMNKDETLRINTLGVNHVYREAVKANIKHFIFMSTLGIYEYMNESELNLDDPKPITLYSKSKILAEKYLRQFQESTTAITVIRSASLFGFSKKFRSDLLINAAVLNAVNSTPLTCHGEGLQIRPLIHIKDVCDHIIGLIYEESPKPFKVNAIYKEEATVKSVLEMVSDLLKATVVTLPQKYSCMSYKAFATKDCELKNNFSICVSDGITRLRKRFNGGE